MIQKRFVWKISLQYLWLWIALIIVKNEVCAQAARAHAFSRWKRVQKNFLKHGTSAAGGFDARWNLFGEPSQTQPLTRPQTHGKVRFCPPGKNPLTSHAVRFCKCCLGLPLAFYAAFRCWLRKRFLTGPFVNFFLPLDFSDRLPAGSERLEPAGSFYSI